MATIDRLFSLKHNRWFGLHNPFSSKLSKAADPYINTFSLKRLLKDPQSKLVAAENILGGKATTSRSLSLFKAILGGDFDKSIKSRIIDILMQNLRSDNAGDFAVLVFQSNVNINLKEKLLGHIINKFARKDLDYKEFFLKIANSDPAVIAEICQSWTKLKPWRKTTNYEEYYFYQPSEEVQITDGLSLFHPYDIPCSSAYEAIPAALKIGFNVDQIVNLIERIAERNKDFTPYLLFMLPTLLEITPSAKLTPEQITDVLEMVHLRLKITLSAPGARITQEQVADLIKKEVADLIKNKLKGLIEGELSEIANKYEVPIEVVASLREAGLNTKQIVDFFNKIAVAVKIDEQIENSTGDKTWVAFRALPAALEAGLNTEQIIDLFGKIASIPTPTDLQFDPYYIDNAANTFIALPFALNAATKGSLTPEQIVDLFRKIVEKSGSFADKALTVLPETLEAARKAGLTLERIVNLLGEIVEKTGNCASDAFHSLPSTLQAGLNKEQIIDLFGEIVEKNGIHAPAAFDTLPAALYAGLNKEQIMDLFGKIVKKANIYWWQGNNFHNLRVALEFAKKAGLIPEQIVGLLGEIVEKNERGAWETLQATLKATIKSG